MRPTEFSAKQMATPAKNTGKTHNNGKGTALSKVLSSVSIILKPDTTHNTTRGWTKR